MGWCSLFCLKEDWFKGQGKCILVNNSGYYFDFLCSELETFVVDINELKEDSKDLQVIKYPKTEELNNNLEKIIKSNVLIVSNTQDLGVVSNYFRMMTIPFNRSVFLEFINYDFDKQKPIDEQLIMFRDDEFVRFVFVFMKMLEDFSQSVTLKRINPSWFFGVNSKNYRNIITQSCISELYLWAISKNYNNTVKYLDCKSCFEIDIFTDVLYYDIISEKNNKIDLMVEILRIIEKKGSIDITEYKKTIDLEKLNLKESDIKNIFTRLKKQNIIFEKTTSCFILKEE